jgi:mono/diheme cytochrome c family protein
MSPPLVPDPNVHTSRSHPYQKEIHLQKLLLLLILVSIVALAACGGKGEVTEPGGGAATGDPAAGEQVYQKVASPGCATCHSLEAGQTIIGPSLNNIGTVAATRVDGMSAEGYLRQAIVDPNAHVVEGFGSNIMPATYKTQLGEEQINDLIAFLLIQ